MISSFGGSKVRKPPFLPPISPLGPPHTLCVCGGGGWVPQVPATTTSGGGRNYFYYIKKRGGITNEVQKMYIFFDPCPPPEKLCQYNDN